MRLSDWFWLGLSDLRDLFRRPASRDNPPPPPERLAEIAIWLQRPISPAEALAIMARIDPAMKDRNQPCVRGLQAWIGEHREPGDQLWWYDTGGDSWENLRGEDGFAIVRNGNVIAFYMLEMN